MKGLANVSAVEAVVASIVVGSLVGCTILSGASELDEEEGCTGVCGARSEDKIEQKDQALPGPSSQWKDGGQVADAGTKFRAKPEGDGGKKKKGGVPCGEDVCSGPRSTCCVAADSTKSCIHEKDSCGGVKIACSSQEDCGKGEVCCLKPLETQATCTAERACIEGTFVQLCQSDADCPADLECYANEGSLEDQGTCR
jgi:hypothetical protein